MTLEAIAREYERGEISAVWLHDRNSSPEVHRLVCAVVELCPAEQTASPPIGSEGHPTMRRAELSRNRTLYASRCFVESAAAAIPFYRGAGGKRTLPVSSGAVELGVLSDLDEEAPSEVPVLVDQAGEAIYGHVLPARRSSVRVCSRFGRGASQLEEFSQQERERVRAFVQSALCFDIVQYSEHFGAVHLCMSNPLLRAMEERLAGNSSTLLVSFHEREGKNVAGCTMELTDHRPGGVGFVVRQRVDGRRAIVALPCEPVELETRLYDSTGSLLEFQRAVFLKQITLNVGLVTGERHIETRTASGAIEKHKIATVSRETSRHLPSGDPPGRALGEALRRRRNTTPFWFFRGGDASRDEARRIVRGLIGAASDRCMLCDPYLSQRDVIDYAAFVETQSMPVRLLTSAAHARLSDEGGRAYADSLAATVRDLTAREPSLRLECRVLLGRDKSPVHDRFMIIDDRAYVLGSSLNEFGARATTLIQLPDPGPVTAFLEEQWNDNTRTAPLEDWLGKRTPEVDSQ